MIDRGLRWLERMAGLHPELCGEDMLKDKWEFEMTSKQLAEAAGRKKDHHDQRQRFWETCKQQTIMKIKESGIDVEESVAGTSYTSGRPAAVTISATLQRDLMEAQKKVEEHRDLVRVYAGWVEVLKGTHALHALKLHHDDYLFFFGTS